MKYESQYYGVVQMEDIIEHHGIKGMKWGVRRYQNPDGSLTAAGRARYLSDISKGKIGIDDLPDSQAKQNYKKAVKDFEQAQSERYRLEDEFYANRDGKTVEKYSKISAEKHWDEAKKSGWTDDRKDEWVRGYTHGDLDQGEKTAFDYWLDDKHADHVKRYTESGRAHASAKQALVKEIVGEHTGKMYRTKEMKYDWKKRKYVSKRAKKRIDDIVSWQIQFRHGNSRRRFDTEVFP